MITLEQAKEIWQDIGLDDYDDQDVCDRVDDYGYEVNRFYEVDEGRFIAYGILTCGEFELEGIDFEGNDGEEYSIPTC